jgi:hypothetical protein
MVKLKYSGMTVTKGNFCSWKNQKQTRFRELMLQFSSGL